MASLSVEQHLVTPSLKFVVDKGHNMTIVEADENYVQPFKTQNLYIYSGETYSIEAELVANENRTLLTKLVKGWEKHQPARNDDQLLGVDFLFLPNERKGKNEEGE
ncbi:hypothetical protein WN943_023835 [Citrus x changshan-huyou]